MRPNARETGDSRRFVHQALIYESEEQFLAGAVPFVERGVAAGEPVLAAVQGANAEALRAAIGTDAPGFSIVPAEDWYETSARTREKVASWVEEHGDGGRVRLIGEPAWALGHEAQVRDLARHESVVNVAFADCPVSFICPYDARTLPDEILEHAERTHPELVAGDGEAAASSAYEDPHSFCSGLARDAPHAGTPVSELEFGSADLPALRRLVEWESLFAGLEPTRVDELVLAVNELATNALVHGEAPARLMIWNEDGEVIFEVEDRGEGIGDALAGQLRPSPGGAGGRGLWLSRLMADALEIHSDEDSNTVALHVSLPGQADPVRPGDR